MYSIFLIFDMNKTIGATFLVAGTTIGAGMLGLPIVAAKFGLVNSVLFLCFMWAIMCYSAILLLKLMCNYGHAINIAKLSSKYYGKIIGMVGNVSIIVLFFALLTAYLSASSNLISQITSPGIEITNSISYPLGHPYVIGIIISVAMLLLFFNKVRVVDIANRIVFVVKIIALGFALVALGGNINFGQIESNVLSNLPNFNFFTVTLIFFITFGFHGSIPALLQYLDNDYKQARFSMIVGSLIPLVLFLFWTIFTLLVVYSQSETDILSFVNSDQEMRAFKELMSKSLHGSYVIFLDIFMLCAIFTSYFGVAVGLLYYVKESILLPPSDPKAPIVPEHEKMRHYSASILVVLIPLAVLGVFNDVFIKALSLGAAMLAIIAVVLPSMVAIKMKITSEVKLKHNMFLPCALFNLAFGLMIVGFEALEALRSFQ